MPIPGTPHQLEATLDGLIRNVDTNLAYILEHKTFGRHPDELDLMREDQFVAYSWVLSKLCETGLSEGVGGVAYDGMWKRAEPPKGRVVSDCFIRLTITHNKHQLEEFEKYLVQEVTDMAEAAYHPAQRYPNKNGSMGTCSDCSLTELCDAMSNGEDYQYLIDSFYVPRDPGERADVWPTVSH